MTRVTLRRHRHAERVSAFIAPSETATRADKWTLKQVQGDEIGAAALRSFAPSRDPAFHFLAQRREDAKTESLIEGRWGDANFL